jgi:peroxiredoxin
MPLQTGDAAPDFTLFDDAKAPFKLSEARQHGPVVLLFFPGAFTSVCTTELNTVGNDYGRYTDLGAQVVGISTDSPFALDEFKKANGFPFRLLSDHDATVSAAYGAKYQGDFTPMKLDRISRRAAFVVLPNGTLAYAEVLESAGDQPDFEAILAALDGATAAAGRG